MSVVEGAFPWPLDSTTRGYGELATMTLKLGVAQKQTKSHYFKCGYQQGNRELPSTTKLIGVSGTSDLSDERRLIRSAGYNWFAIFC